MTGSVGILNVGAGDTKLVFDNSNPDEVAKSAKIVEDMIRRGFVLLIEVGRDDKGPTYRRALGFDASTAEYIVAGGPVEQEEERDQKPPSTPRKGTRGKASGRRIPAATTNAVAVARTAGG